jgi:exopolysaccharide biosynthesis protein
MFKLRFVALALLLLFVLPTLGKTHENTYSNPCSELWSAVKEVINNPENYKMVSTDDAKWTAFYDVKHKEHLSISGAVAQKTNQVTLVSQGTGCQMQVVSSFSGLTHDDQGDFVKRVNDALAKQQGAAKPAEPAKP